MFFTLQGRGGRRNGYGPPMCRPPPPDPDPEIVGTVLVANAGGQADRLSFALESQPHDTNPRERFQCGGVGRSPAGGEDHDEALEIHVPTLARAERHGVIGTSRCGIDSRTGAGGFEPPTSRLTAGRSAN